MSSSQKIGVIICAAGRGLRAGFPKNKLLVPFGNGNVLYQTVSAFDFPAIDEIIVTANAEDMQEISELCGFVDANFFTRTFKKAKGVSPTAYRKNYQKR
jgi:2-C-methyl-D-erythritol 4-phosphate cytidylyltransferase